MRAGIQNATDKAVRVQGFNLQDFPGVQAGFPGMTGKLYNQFAMTIVFSFVFSAFNSLSFSPAMSRLFLREKHGPTRFFLFRWFTAALGWVENSYDAVLEWTAHHWWSIVVPSIALLGLTGWMIASRPKATGSCPCLGRLAIS